MIGIVIIISTFIFSFALYNIDIDVILYPSILSLVLVLIILTLDMTREYKRIEKLRMFLSFIKEEDIKLPMTNDVEVKEYHKIINELMEQRHTYMNDMEMKYEDMICYYTMWTHQIKTPIFSMKLKLEEEDSPQSLRLNSDLSKIERYVEMALTYLKLDGGNIDFVFKKHKLDDLIRETLHKHSDDFIIKKLKLEYEPISQEVITDEKWFSFVLQQLISNAVKYTNEGFVKIYSNQENQLCIQDSGIGISSHDLKRLFEKGYTGFNGRNYKNSSGIGLYLSKKILDKLGIDIEVKSKENVGTIVLLTFHQKKY